MKQYPLGWGRETTKVKTSGMTPSHQANKRETTLRWVRKTKTQSCLVTHTQEGTQNSEFLPEEQSIHSSHPAAHLLRPAPEISPQNICFEDQWDSYAKTCMAW